ncbi:hypothetical protein BASA61_002696 [Batrachochytrium salamandrivorans]|nr:hypothetical protein BASA61_002696 [Batrachochytrium salamandrivorans]
MGVPLLNQRIRVCVHGVLYNLHLVLVPFFKRHTAQNYVKLIKVLLDSLSPIWRDKLDIVVKNATHGVLDESFYKTAHAFSVHLRAQQTLMTEMGSKCPKGHDTWIAFGSILKWLLQHRRQLMAHVTNKRPVQASSDQWWIIAAALAPVFEKLQIAFARLQSSDLIISQQPKFLSNLMLTVEFQSTVNIGGGCHICALYFCQWIANTGERDSNNNARELEASPVIPADLVKLLPCAFHQRYPGSISQSRCQTLDQDMIDLIEIQHRELIVVYGREPDVKAALDTHDEKTYFNDA